MSDSAAAPDAPYEEEGPGLEAVPDPDEAALVIEADGQLGMKVSGRKPDSAVLKVKGAKIDLDGQFNRGDRLVTVVTLQVTGDNDQDTIETLSGEVKSTSKAQSATVCGIAQLEDWLRGRLEPALADEDVAALAEDGGS